ncbi:hypothetical protein [Serratia rubidaea]|uniref:Uncharacterized protein n=1 Tax=Serratia rubidaea TaxID=61652 RepID=A0ABS0MGM9_SERRU|nr:hypothetical protein [Serratia rubidaea]MBH1931513.1 hypothetical protein [Serratia rubidaea]
MVETVARREDPKNLLHVFAIGVLFVGSLTGYTHALIITRDASAALRGDIRSKITAVSRSPDGFDLLIELVGNTDAAQT